MSRRRRMLVSPMPRSPAPGPWMPGPSSRIVRDSEPSPVRASIRIRTRPVRGSGRRVRLDVNLDAVAKPHALDVEVLVQERELALKCDELRRFGEQAGAQQVPQAQDHSPGPSWLAANQRQERVQGVEEEVRLELRLQGRELCLEEGAANRLARGQPPDAQAVPTPDEKETGGRAEDPEPGRLEQGARERHFRYRTAIAPDAVLVGSEHVEPVAPRRQVRVIGGAAPSRLDPAAVKSFQPVPETDRGRILEGESRVVKLQVALRRSQREPARSGERLTARLYGFDDDLRRHGI